MKNDDLFELMKISVKKDRELIDILNDCNASQFKNWLKENKKIENREDRISLISDINRLLINLDFNKINVNNLYELISDFVRVDVFALSLWWFKDEDISKVFIKENIHKINFDEDIVNTFIAVFNVKNISTKKVKDPSDNRFNISCSGMTDSIWNKYLKNNTIEYSNYILEMKCNYLDKKIKINDKLNRVTKI